MRQIFICADITAPLYWWKEADQYKVGTVTDSCSTMPTRNARFIAGLEVTPIRNRDCSSLRTLNLPLGILRIGDSAFSGCSALSELHFSGSLAQWTQIQIGAGNDPLLTAALSCENEAE